MDVGFFVGWFFERFFGDPTEAPGRCISGLYGWGLRGRLFAGACCGVYATVAAVSASMTMEPMSVHE
jgi:hypothetical protein